MTAADSVQAAVAHLTQGLPSWAVLLALLTLVAVVLSLVLDLLARRALRRWWEEGGAP